MRLNASDPDIETLVGRIERGDLDLQPDFQRGEVWPRPKQQRLIDTILRDWHVPPVHVVEVEGGKKVVLDGQQRLAAIRDFMRGALKVNGSQEPHDQFISGLDGLTYNDLPEDARLRFNSFGIRLFTITDYQPAEPSELFYRLNQPHKLSPAEQRNAFFGEVRSDVKRFVELMLQSGVDDDFLGFSNSRMAYDDIIAKVVFALDSNTLRRRLTASALAERYRQGAPLSANARKGVESALYLMAKIRESVPAPKKQNKATAFSWLFFLSRLSLDFERDPECIMSLADFYVMFEDARVQSRQSTTSFSPSKILVVSPDITSFLLRAYNDRSTSRVTDVNSVLVRDIVLWTFFLACAPRNLKAVTDSGELILELVGEITDGLARTNSLTDDILSKLLDSTGWGEHA